ncbi:MAG: tetratricopeptide repeat protein [Caulobacteraceae bacterium]|nr:tetratricopeptide repeat protein [Caulobacteraceae bacterium]
MGVLDTRRLSWLPIFLGLATAVSAATPPSNLPKGDPRLVPTGWAQAEAFRRGMKLGEQGRYARAIVEFDNAIDRQPQFALAITMRGFARMELGDYQRAIADHDRTLELAPDHPNSWSNACWARAVANTDLQRALELCDKAVELRPDIDALDRRGFTLFRRGDMSAALRDYNAALTLSPQQAGPLFMRGVLRLKAGDANGQDDIEKADRIDRKVRPLYARWGVQP